MLTVFKVNWLPPTACVVTNSSQTIQIINSHICTKVDYTIAFPIGTWCELILKGSHDEIDKYFVKALHCPALASAWILPMLHSNYSQYAFCLSLHSPFHYCLSHSSHLNFFTPNSQSQIWYITWTLSTRSQFSIWFLSLSTMFKYISASNYTHCNSRPYIALNLTVTDGTINSFILYVNIISINTPVFFPCSGKFTPTYILIHFTS